MPYNGKEAFNVSAIDIDITNCVGHVFNLHKFLHLYEFVARAHLQGHGRP